MYRKGKDRGFEMEKALVVVVGWVEDRSVSWLVLYQHLVNIVYHLQVPVSLPSITTRDFSGC